MSESNREHLSCLMDGELNRSGRKFLLRRLAEDADMKATWRRFHVVRASLHKEVLATRDLGARIAVALEDEPLPGESSRMARWFRPVAGSAIAASVALVAIVGINSSMLENSGSETTGDEQPGFVSQPTSLDQPFTRAAVPVSFSEGGQAERQRISGYVLRHHQASGRAGFVSYVPIVTGMSEEPSARELPDSEPTDR